MLFLFRLPDLSLITGTILKNEKDSLPFMKKTWRLMSN